MRLLVCTQKVDKDDPVLGFFHDWLAIMSTQCEKVTVICLFAGKNSLPANVKILSLGKENNNLRITRLIKFFYYIFKFGKNYDSVFVHMNTIYVVLAGVWWRLTNKKIALWYIHPIKDPLLSVALFFVDYVFTATKYSFPITSKKMVVTGHGIDTKKFIYNEEINKFDNSIVFVGRITPIKKIELLIKAVRIVRKNGTLVTLNIFGGMDKENQDYFRALKEGARDLESLGVVVFGGLVNNNDMPRIYSQHELLVNLTPEGSFDKVVLEAAACGTIVLTTNKLFSDVVPKELIVDENNVEKLADKIKQVLTAPQEVKKRWSEQLRQVVVSHDLEGLIKKIIIKLS